MTSCVFSSCNSTWLIFGIFQLLLQVLWFVSDGPITFDSIIRKRPNGWRRFYRMHGSHPCPWTLPHRQQGLGPPPVHQQLHQSRRVRSNFLSIACRQLPVRSRHFWQPQKRRRRRRRKKWKEPIHGANRFRFFCLFLKGLDNPEYFHMPGVNGHHHSNGHSAFQPVRSSSPQYIGEYLHPRTLAHFDQDDDDDYETGRKTSPQQQSRWHSASPKVFLPNSSTVSLPASAVLGLRGRSATPTAVPTTNPTALEVHQHKRSHSVGASHNLNLQQQPKPILRQERSSLEALAACEEQLEERRRKVFYFFVLLIV